MSKMAPTEETANRTKTLPAHASTMNRPVFLYESYREYLLYLTEVRQEVRGFRTRLAEAASCQPSYLSQVLAGTASFSLDQLHGISRYLDHTEVEWEYLRELGIRDRAASPRLREDCSKRLSELRERQGGTVALFVENAPPPDREAMMWYAESWQHGAVFVSLSSEFDRNVKEVAAQLSLPHGRAEAILEELARRKFAKKSGTGFRAAAPMLYWQHGTIYNANRMNWINHGQHRRMEGYDRGLHVGGLTSMSRADFERIKGEMLVDYRRRFHAWAEPAKKGGDAVVFFGLDFFEAQ